MNNTDNKVYSCPQCGGEDYWFDRSITFDGKGREIEPMMDRCNNCGVKMKNLSVKYIRQIKRLYNKSLKSEV